MEKIDFAGKLWGGQCGKLPPLATPSFEEKPIKIEVAIAGRAVPDLSGKLWSENKIKEKNRKIDFPKNDGAICQFHKLTY